MSDWLIIAAYVLMALGFVAGGYLYWVKVRTNPLVLLADAWGWAVRAWPYVKPVLIKIGIAVFASSPETQARAREDSRQRNEPDGGNPHRPDR